MKMFLNLLFAQEQEFFLELAYHTIGLDGVYHEEEMKLFNSYKHECHMVNYEVSKQNDISFIVDSLKNSSSKSKRIILIELFGIGLADGEFCVNEQKFMRELAKSFDMNDNDFETFHKWVIAMNQIVDVGYKLIYQK